MTTKVNKKWKEKPYECWKNKNFMIGFIVLLSIVLIAIFADQIAPYDYTQQNVGGRYEPPKMCIRDRLSARAKNYLLFVSSNC